MYIRDAKLVRVGQFQSQMFIIFEKQALIRHGFEAHLRFSNLIMFFPTDTTLRSY